MRKITIFIALVVALCFGHHGVTREGCRRPENVNRPECRGAVGPPNFRRSRFNRGFDRVFSRNFRQLNRGFNRGFRRAFGLNRPQAAQTRNTFRPPLQPVATLRRRNRFAQTPQARVPIARVPITRVPISPRRVARLPFTRPPVTRAPFTRAPVTRPPVTRPPIIRSPVTRAPINRAPMTRVPVTRAPITRPPVTRAPVTRAPITRPPTTQAPTTTRAPTTTTTTQAPGQQTNGARIGPIRSELQAMLRSSPRLIAAWVQLGFHACVGGCDGCLDLNVADNRGLAGTYGQLRELHVKHQSDITLADLVTLAAVEAANEGMRRGGGPGNVPFRIGRRTCANPDRPVKGGNFPQGNDPNALDVLIREFSLTRREAIALIGAHSLGRCTPANTGFDGVWDNTPMDMDNGYYRAMVGSEWLAAPAPGGSTQWVVDRNNIGSRMMLHPDMRLLKSFTVSGRNDTPSCVADCAASADAPTVSSFASSAQAFFTAFTPAYVKMLEKTSDTLRNV